MAKGSNLTSDSPAANPVCKVMDFSKFLRERKAGPREPQEAESRRAEGDPLNPCIATHDLQTKIKHIEEFPKEHNKARHRGVRVARTSTGTSAKRSLTRSATICPPSAS